jgi:hypothetical protein
MDVELGHHDPPTTREGFDQRDIGWNHVNINQLQLVKSVKLFMDYCRMGFI